MHCLLDISYILNDLNCRFDGKTIKVPKREETHSPKIGNIVTFNSLPGTHEASFDSRFMRVCAVRYDITWRDVVDNAKIAKREYTSTLQCISLSLSLSLSLSIPSYFLF